MKRTFSVLIALFLILGLSLVAYSDGITLREAAPSPTSAGGSVAGAKIFVQVTPSPTLAGDTVVKEQMFEKVAPSPTSAGDSLSGERKSEEVTPSPPPVEEKIVREVTPSPTPVGDLVAGKKVFVSACKVCHRKDLIHNDFITDSTDQELVAFIKTGGLPNQPLVMLPKGGKPSLTDEKLYDIVAYLRSLQE